MALLNYSTKIRAAQTVGEIHAMLAAAGAGEIMTRYVERRAVGVSFSLDGPRGKLAFALPVQVDEVAAIMRRQLRTGELKSGGGLSRATLESVEHAERVAWRIAKDWLEAQLALVEAAMVTLDQVMLSYLLLDADTTLYQRFVSTGLRELEP
jgi:hypothetical protein